MKFLVLATSKRGNQYVEKLINLGEIADINICDRTKEIKLKTIENRKIRLDKFQYNSFKEFLKSKEMYSPTFTYQ